MASIHLRKSTWYAMWYENGKHIMRTTNIKAKGEKEKKLAQNAADAMEQAAKGNISVSQAVGALRKIASTLGLASKVPTVQEYLTNYKPKGSHSHVQSIMRAIDRFLDYLGSEAYTTLDMLSVARCREFIEILLKKLSFTTVRSYKSHLHTALQIAVEEEIIERNPFALVSMRRLNQRNAIPMKRLPFSLSEIHTIINKSPSPWSEMVLLSILTGGQRLGDIACMKWSQIKWDDGVIVIRTMKTGKVIATPITKTLERLLTPLCPQKGDYIFPEMAARYIRSNGCLSCEFVAILKALGIASDKNMHTSPAGRLVCDKSFHSLRHTVVSMLRVNANFTSDLVRETVGHDSEAVERGYFTPDVSAKRTVIDYLAEKIAPTANFGEG